MCLSHSDCPSSVPLCVPGQYARSNISNPNERKRNSNSSIGTIKCIFFYNLGGIVGVNIY